MREDLSHGILPESTLEFKGTPRAFLGDMIGLQPEQKQVGSQRNADRFLNLVKVGIDLVLAQSHGSLDFLEQDFDVPTALVQGQHSPCRQREMGDQNMHFVGAEVTPPFGQNQVHMTQLMEIGWQPVNEVRLATLAIARGNPELVIAFRLGDDLFEMPAIRQFPGFGQSQDVVPALLAKELEIGLRGKACVGQDNHLLGPGWDGNPLEQLRQRLIRTLVANRFFGANHGKE